MPYVDTDGTTIEIHVAETNNVAIITWSVNNIESFTHIIVRVCLDNTEECMQHNVTDVSSTSQLNIPEGEKHVLSFYMYDGVELVHSQETAISTGSGKYATSTTANFVLYFWMWQIEENSPVLLFTTVMLS